MYDLLILAFNQKEHMVLCTDKIRVKATNKKGGKVKKYYCKIWPFINNCHGILYKLFINGNLGEFECCDEMFEFSDNNKLNNIFKQIYPNIADECVNDWVSIKLIVDYAEDFFRIFDELLNSSPISTIAFLCRGQSLDKEIIVGTLSRNDFVQMLSIGNIKTNICYIISSGI